MTHTTVGAMLLVLVLLVPTSAEAKKFKYASGPKAPEDTVLSVAEVDLEPIVRSRGPRVPATNLQLATLVANAAFDRILADAPIDSGGHVLVVPAASHPLNFVVEHAVLRHLARRHVTATVRRAIVPDDSLALVASNPGHPVLEYTVATARITYLRLVGWLPGRVRIERQALVEGKLTMRDPATGNVLWIADADHNLVDSFPQNQLPLVEDDRYGELKGAVPERNFGRVLEPVLVVAVVVGLVALFFQNRP